VRVGEYRLSDLTYRADTRKELKIFYVSIRTREYKIRWFKYLRRMEDSFIPRILYEYKPKGKRDLGCP
jgi:hypothetical protein